MDEQWRSRITIEPGKRSGQPCIRGMRKTVYDVLSYLAAGMSVAEVLDDFPYLTPEDIQACLAYAAADGRGDLSEEALDELASELFRRYEAEEAARCEP
jgi:uncharacterized protein (DUF433 family)